MADVPHIPCTVGPALYPSILTLHWLAAMKNESCNQVQMNAIPYANGSLPDLLSLSDITHLSCPAMPQHYFTWEGHGGARLMVNEEANNTDDDNPRFDDLHHGAFPAAGIDAPQVGSKTLLKLIDLARLEDASAVCGSGKGAEWEHILGLLGKGIALRTPPLGGRLPDENLEAASVWNPLPLKRLCLVQVPLAEGIKPPWAIEDEAGRTYAVQVVDEEQDDGSKQRYLLSQISLGALESRRIHAYSEPVNTCNWEVSETVLDNGLIRAEFDDLGHIQRLCINGEFSQWNGPALQIREDGLPVDGNGSCEVLEGGPIRARIRFVREINDTRISITYTLFAERDYIGVQVDKKCPNNETEWTIDHPTAFRRAPLRCAGELAPWTVPQRRDLLHPLPVPQAGCHWAALSDEQMDDGLALVSSRPMTVHAHDGHLQILLPENSDYIICSHRGSASEGLGLGQLAQSIHLPARMSAPAPEQNELIRLVAARNLVPLWIRKPDDWDGEILFAEQGGLRNRAYLYPRDGINAKELEACRVASDGSTLQSIQNCKEQDGFQIDLMPYEIFLMRWRKK